MEIIHLNQRTLATRWDVSDGYELRTAHGINIMRRKWEMTFANRATATADAIVAFFKAAGAVQSFSWTPAYGEAGKWVCREWKDSKTGPSTRTITATFDEVFEA